MQMIEARPSRSVAYKPAQIEGYGLTASEPESGMMQSMDDKLTPRKKNFVFASPSYWTGSLKL